MARFGLHPQIRTVSRLPLAVALLAGLSLGGNSAFAQGQGGGGQGGGTISTLR